MNNKITAPYNFIPYTNQVAKPKWAQIKDGELPKNISQDIYIPGNETGEISIEITAENAIFTPKTIPNQDRSEVKEFSNVDGKYFIPGSTIKGSIRKVFEVLTFSKQKAVEDIRYSFRDFESSNEEYDKFKKNAQEEVKSGWLYKKDDSYYLIDTGEPIKIKQRTLLQEYPNLDLKTNAVEYKYKSANLETTSEGYFIVTERDKNKRVFAEPSDQYDQNAFLGSIVLTGNMDKKRAEWVFRLKGKRPIKLKKNTIKDLFVAMYEDVDANQHADWKWRRKQLQEGKKLPVFFRYSDDNNIKDIGFSFLYKIAYKNSVHQLMSPVHFDESVIDFTECLFGTTFAKSEKNDSVPSNLKSRVAFTDAWEVTGTPKSLPVQYLMLLSPKPSYYPNYVKQEDSFNTYNTYSTNKATISGRKFYPVKSTADSSFTESQNSEIETIIRPLASGTKFQFKLKYHNLNQIELGAILSALTFHNNNSNTYHSIGSGAPYGYGRCSFKIMNSDCLEHPIEKYLSVFENYMNSEINDWLLTPQVVELFCVSQIQKNQENYLRYMELKEFAKNKGVNKKLALHSTGSAKPNIKSYLNNNLEIPEPFYSNLTLKDFKQYLNQLQQEKKIKINTLIEKANTKASQLKKNIRLSGAEDKFIGELNDLHISKESDEKKLKKIINDYIKITGKISQGSNPANLIEQKCQSLIDVTREKKKAKKIEVLKKICLKAELNINLN